MRDIACRDCVVSVLIGAPSGEIVEEESRVIDLLASRGMVPPLRYAHKDGYRGDSQPHDALSG